MTADSKNKIYSKILLSAVVSANRYILEKEYFKGFDMQKSLAAITGDETLGSKKPLDIDPAYMEQFNELRYQLSELLKDLIIFNTDYDLTIEKYPLTKAFLGAKAITSDENGIIFRGYFAEAYKLLLKTSKAESLVGKIQNPTQDVINFLEDCRVVNSEIFDYLGIGKKNTMTADLFRKLLVRIESNKTENSEDYITNWLSENAQDLK